MLNNPQDILSILLRGVVGRSGRKRARRAVNFMGGHGGFLTASTLMAVAGVAWGIYDSVKGSAAPAPGAMGGATVPPPLPPLPMPPLPDGTTAAAPIEAASLPSDVLRVIRLAVSAARADGELAPQERAVILDRAREAGVESVVDAELATVRPLPEILAGAADAQKSDLYVLAFTIVRADETVTGAERIYLAQLAFQLGLDAATVTRLESETAARIDAQPE